MDRLKQLEEKKRKLQELREKRKYVTGSIPIVNSSERLKSLLQNVDSDESKTEVISISTQTDDPITQSDDLTHIAVVPEIITYEKSVQTEYIEEPEQGNVLDMTAQNIELSETESVPNKEASKGSLESSEGSKKNRDSNVVPRVVIPFVLQDQGITVTTKTFSLAEALEKNSSCLLDQGVANGKNYHLSHVLTPESESSKTAMCVSIDTYEGFVLSVVQYSEQALMYSSGSVVYVYKFDTGELVDVVEFRGQTLLRGEFIRNHSSQIIAIILTSYNGKTILYELRAASTNNGPINVERNIISKNYHNYPVFALWQYHTKDARFLTASTDGTIHEIDALDMSIYQEATSNSTPLSFKLLPVSASDLILKDAPPAHSALGIFWEHLSRISLYDEIAVVSVVTLAEDATTLYFGCEDGGIYKVIPQGEMSKNNAVKVAFDNNGFIPLSGKQSRQESRSERIFENPFQFHSAPVTGLYRCGDLPNLLLSSGMDWKCILWDVVNSEKLTTIDLEHPVITCEWVIDGEDHLIFILTAKSLDIFRLRLSRQYSSMDSVSWSLLREPELEFSIDVATCEQLRMFSWFKALSQSEDTFVILGGDSGHNYCFKLSLAV